MNFDHAARRALNDYGLRFDLSRVPGTAIAPPMTYLWIAYMRYDRTSLSSIRHDARHCRLSMMFALEPKPTMSNYLSAIVAFKHINFNQRMRSQWWMIFKCRYCRPGHDRIAVKQSHLMSKHDVTFDMIKFKQFQCRSLVCRMSITIQSNQLFSCDDDCPKVPL